MLKCLSEDSIKAAISVAEAMASQREAFVALEMKKVQIPERIIASTSHGSSLFKPFLTEDTFGLKVVSVRNGAVPGLIVLFDAVSGAPTALMSATYLTGLRTAAGSAVACDLLCSKKENVHTMTVFGAGLQAETHAICFAHVLKHLKRLYIVNRSLDKAEALAARLQEQLKHVQVAAIDSKNLDLVGKTISQSQCIVTATTSTAPLFDGHDVQKVFFFSFFFLL